MPWLWVRSCYTDSSPNVMQLPSVTATVTLEDSVTLFLNMSSVKR